MSYRYVQPKDKQEYDKCCFRYVEQLFGAAERPPTLYHYTTGSGLISIITSGNLWTTQIANLNDAQEILHAVDLFKEAIARRRTSGLNPTTEFMFNKLEDGLNKPNPESLGVFVTCFSTKHDDLSQWRAYGGSEGGYCIGFSFEHLGTAGVIRNQALLAPVLYDPPAKQALLDDVVAKTEEFFLHGLGQGHAPSLEEWTDDFLHAWIASLTFIAPLIKHQAFKDEGEWRLIYPYRDHDHARMRYIQRGYMLRRHVPLTFADADELSYTPLPITGITVGPTPHPQLCRIGVGDLLKSHRYDASIKPAISEVPYRLV